MTHEGTQTLESTIGTVLKNDMISKIIHPILLIGFSIASFFLLGEFLLSAREFYVFPIVISIFLLLFVLYEFIMRKFDTVMDNITEKNIFAKALFDLLIILRIEISMFLIIENEFYIPFYIEAFIILIAIALFILLKVKTKNISVIKKTRKLYLALLLIMFYVTEIVLLSLAAFYLNSMVTFLIFSFALLFFNINYNDIVLTKANCINRPLIFTLLTFFSTMSFPFVIIEIIIIMFLIL
ncbi:MAG: hypothetical protein LBM87_03730 [Ruminococcus sp.]|jgi:hypothetical protein|nr:hypothetical protein [Ruminococcus sp.]